MRNRTAAQIQKENLYGVGEVRLFSVGFQQFMHNKSKKRDVKKLNRVFSHPLTVFFRKYQLYFFLFIAHFVHIRYNLP